MSNPVTVDDVLTFWFAHPEKWFAKDDAFDAALRERFLDLHAAIERGEHEDWCATPRGALAYVIVLDQFSRNMFRGKGRMFASDARALTAAKETLDRGQDQALTPTERRFLYMPFMHSEALADQDRCVALFQALGEPISLDFAERHREIIRRFGRFPHRNALLGRDSTDEEREFLTQPGSSF